MLGTYKIVTSSPATSSRSRPSSSSSPAPRAPASLSARWSSYTTPLAPLPQRSPSTLLDEVETLKAQLDASEALVKRLMKEKLEVVSTSQRICLGLQKERSQLLKEREELMTKLRLLDEVEATPGLLPPTGGVWLAGSSQEQDPAQKLSKPLPPIPTSGSEHDLGITEARQDAEIRLNRPAALEARSQPIVSEMRDARFEYDPESSTDEDVLARIGSIFLDSTSQADGCEPGALPRAHHRSHRRRNAIEGSRSIPPIVKRAQLPSETPVPISPPPASLNAPEFSCGPGNPVQSPPIRSVSARAQARPPQANLIDLASKIVGSDACPGYSGRQGPNSWAKSMVKDGKAAAGTPPLNLQQELSSTPPWLACRHRLGDQGSHQAPRAGRPASNRKSSYTTVLRWMKDLQPSGSMQE
ncbi:hypothetical protein FRC05_005290 [Tulasnella sp. 425]|nr:hypothetical protein FRC05_005290 [Tulasnella sp. 425]